MRLPLSQRRHQPWEFGVFLLVLLTGLPSVRAQITFNTALPVAEDHVIIRLQTIYRSFRMESNGRTLDVYAFPLVTVWGASSRLAVIGVFPYLHKRTQFSGMPDRSASGVSDLTIIARYTLFQWDRPGQTVRLAPFVSIRAPVGSSTRSDSFGQLPRFLQPGTGAWAPGAGVTFTWQRLAAQMDAALQYISPLTDEGFRFGRELKFDAGYRYRVLPRRLSAGVPGFLYLALESNLQIRGRHRQEGVAIPGTHRTTWLLSPGVQYVTRRWVIEAAVQLPVAQDVGTNTFRYRSAFVLSFRLSV